uniref:Integrase n=1 Tax=Candidatus Kentrum sp. FM TaxID=2126340 RepID=A0A450VL52_9GAMM|nr:MAG: Integrase [Candidatus Kentron sp. FM]VFJ43381.1 MAG: Integrase [Candidatus Kentron sp. FM]VFK05523.1 MAG: Integrase [Candidatus Kentron sp. FM]
MLTDITTRSAKPGPKPFKLFDGEGLFLLVTPKGQKWWRLKYRYNGKEKMLSLGVYPKVGLKDARKRRDDARELLANGINPSENRKAQKLAQTERAANSFEVVAREWFAKYSPGWVPAHGQRVLQRLERDVFPWIGARPINDILSPELLTVIRRIEERGALQTAHRALQICGQVFRYAIATGRAERDSAVDLRGALPPAKGKHFAAVTEPALVGGLLRAIDGYHGTFPVCCALRFAPLVFVRPGELCKAQWVDIDLDASEWRYTVTKTDTPHIVPLSRQAVEILTELQPLTGEGRYVFQDERNRKQPMSDTTLPTALRRMGIGKEEMTVHGFRAMARTLLDEVLGFRPDYIEHQLAHAVRDPNGRAYNRTRYLPERREMMQAWADYLDTLRKDAEIIPLKRSA